MSYEDEDHEGYISQEDAEDALAKLELIEKFKRDTCESLKLLLNHLTAWPSTKEAAIDSLPALCEAIDEALYEVRNELREVAGNIQEYSDYEHSTMHKGAGGSL